MGADLSHANLAGINLTNALFDFASVNLRNAVLHVANLESVSMDNANCEGVILGDTKLIGIDLSPLINADVMTAFPSIVDHTSTARSLKCLNLHSFLVRTGMPEIYATYAIDFMGALDQADLFNIMHTTFISYGGPEFKMKSN